MPTEWEPADLEDLARAMAEHGLKIESSSPSGGGGASFTGVQAGTYTFGTGSITINGRGQITAVNG